ncbi:MAG: hypothetical protein GC151_13555 [Betaproteobacteria bacterium]|nr:hypothetical protein [Betaproteobacteria bacterium]
MNTRNDRANGDAPADLASRELAARLRNALRHPAAERLGRRVPLLTTRALVAVDAEDTHLDFTQGRVTVREHVPLLHPWDFAIRGSAAAWAALWVPVPEPGWHDLFALSKRGEMRFEGHLHPFLAHLQFFKDLLSLPRARGTA